MKNQAGACLPWSDSKEVQKERDDAVPRWRRLLSRNLSSKALKTKAQPFSRLMNLYNLKVHT